MLVKAGKKSEFLLFFPRSSSPFPALLDYMFALWVTRGTAITTHRSCFVCLWTHILPKLLEFFKQFWNTGQILGNYSPFQTRAVSCILTCLASKPFPHKSHPRKNRIERHQKHTKTSHISHQLAFFPSKLCATWRLWPLGDHGYSFYRSEKMASKALQALQRKHLGHLGLQPFLRLQKLSKYRHRVIEAAANASQMVNTCPAMGRLGAHGETWKLQPQSPDS